MFVCVLISDYLGLLKIWHWCLCLDQQKTVVWFPQLLIYICFVSWPSSSYVQLLCNLLALIPLTRAPRHIVVSGHQVTRPQVTRPQVTSSQVTRSPGHQLTMSPGHQVTSSPGHQLTSSAGHQVTRSPGHQVTRPPGHQVTRSPHQVTRAPIRVSESTLKEIMHDQVTQLLLVSWAHQVSVAAVSLSFLGCCIKIKPTSKPVSKSVTQ
jgi:hypothetical protein